MSSRILFTVLLVLPGTLHAEDVKSFLPQRWTYSAPLISPENRDVARSHAQKDPSLVFHNGNWHVFMTVKLQGKSVMEHCSFTDWEQANDSKRTLLKVSDRDYFCAPQVFYFEPQQLWYLIYQVGVPGQKKMQVAYSTTKTIADPNSWTKAKVILDGGDDDPRGKGGLDYWVICDAKTAYLFITTNNGKMWRLQTPIEEFPHGFGKYTLALQGDIFEASHTYTIQGTSQYLTLIEVNGRRYFKAYIADRLDGEWRPLAATAEQPFASWKNVSPADGVQPWTDNVSHGELIRASNDQTLTIDPKDLRFVFQGMWEKDKNGLNYGAWNWRIGLLSPSEEP
ncbi:non-reducing end alpha-L-arabinofuranosidase family hydrolase [bacterium]|jgi:hypothetical protein|nr:glycoside hydrolase [Planctomicrobium sp.]MDB4793300.1 non-reducing end alpha-L-arabinofuranosidase family hydrolase [bacterium]